MRTWLVLDVAYLCHRAWHVMPDLRYKGSGTAVVFNFLKSITAFKDQFATDNVAFCFEHPHLFRRDVYPQYKQKRRSNQAQWTKAEALSYQSLRTQIAKLQLDYLPRIGFKNVFCAEGFESDDIMAKIAQDCPDNEEVVLITADTDMLQCLRENVTMYSPQKQKIFTKEWIESTYHLCPSQLALMKSIAGCSTDEVKGIPGVGETTALKFCRGHLPPSSKSYRAILSEQGKEIVRRNRKLVQLPYEGCPAFTLVQDILDKQGWKEVCEEMGMKSIAGRPPVATRTRALL